MLARYSVLWYWETLINANLTNIVFEKLITIKKTRYCYVGYFTLTDPTIYGQLIVTFKRNRYKRSEIMLWRRDGVLLMNYLGEGDSLIYDKRYEFDWIHKN